MSVSTGWQPDSDSLLAAFAAFPLHAAITGSDPPAAADRPIPADLVEAVGRAERVGRALYEQDQVSAVGTDVLIENLGSLRNKNIGGLPQSPASSLPSCTATSIPKTLPPRGACWWHSSNATKHTLPRRSVRQ